MTQEEKQLLLKDLCGRLPYGVIVWFKNAEETSGQVKLGFYNVSYVTELGVGWWKECKPYLRPMSSMTKEEAIEMYFTVDVNADDSRNVINCEVSKDKISFLLEHDGNYAGHRVLFFNDIYSLAQMDWLNKHHFDYRGLIPMGLALEAPEDMYKTE